MAFGRTLRENFDAFRAELKEQRALIQMVNDKLELNRPAHKPFSIKVGAIDPFDFAQAGSQLAKPFGVNCLD